MNRFVAFIKLGRPKFLAGGFVLYGAGTLMALDTIRDLDVRAYVLGQCAITSTQLMTHYSNDYFDVEADRQNQAATAWSGGSRVLADRDGDGPLSPRVARDAAIVLLGIALATDLVIAFGRYGSPVTIALLFAALVLSWSYSGPPLHLHARGFGSITAAIVVGALTALAGVSMQSGGTAVTAAAIRVVVPLAVAQLTMILVLDLPDAKGDALGGKKTLAVRFGTKPTAFVAAALTVVTYLLIIAFGCGTILMLLTLPLGGAFLYELWKWTRQNNLASAGEAENAPKDASRLTSRGVMWFATLSIAMLVSAALKLAQNTLR